MNLKDVCQAFHVTAKHMLVVLFLTQLPKERRLDYHTFKTNE